MEIFMRITFIAITKKHFLKCSHKACNMIIEVKVNHISLSALYFDHTVHVDAVSIDPQ